MDQLFFLLVLEGYGLALVVGFIQFLMANSRENRWEKFFPPIAWATFVTGIMWLNFSDYIPDIWTLIRENDFRRTALIVLILPILFVLYKWDAWKDPRQMI
jgi:hypothetical protein